MKARARRLGKETCYGEDLHYVLPLRISHEQMRLLKKLADRRNKYPSSYLRDLLDRHLKLSA
jgi:hypothetical protein